MLLEWKHKCTSELRELESTEKRDARKSITFCRNLRPLEIGMQICWK